MYWLLLTDSRAQDYSFNSRKEHFYFWLWLQLKPQSLHILLQDLLATAFSSLESSSSSISLFLKVMPCVTTPWQQQWKVGVPSQQGILQSLPACRPGLKQLASSMGTPWWHWWNWAAESSADISVFHGIAVWVWSISGGCLHLRGGLQL